MRKTHGGIYHLAEISVDNLEGRETGLSKPQRYGLADIAASVLTCCSVNTSALANILPRAVKSSQVRYRLINRWLPNTKINPIHVMKGFVPELLEALTAKGQVAILMLDQNQLGNGFVYLMVCLRFGERTLPIAWKVKQTKGAMGFDQQQPLLESVYELIPKDSKLMLTADRFDGTAALISLCQSFGWQYRIRIQGNGEVFTLMEQ